MASGQEGGHVPLSPVGDVTSVVELGAQLQAEASRHGIHNVFDDGGYKELLILRLFGLHKLDRTGDDAEDDSGRRYEIKTVARIDARGNRKKNLSITTEHTLTVDNLARYRNVYLWIIAVFDQAQPEAIYEIPPASLERYFADWETKLVRQEGLRAEGGAPVHLNNPKIPLGFIERNGTRVWPEGPAQLRLDVEAGLAEAADTLPGA
jgi:Restriction endonuclease PvuII